MTLPDIARRANGYILAAATLEAQVSDYCAPERRPS